MRTIQPSHEVLSLFNLSGQTPALTRKLPNRGLIVSIVSAFFIVLMLGLLLNLAQNFLSRQEPLAFLDSPLLARAEPVAWQPGTYIGSYLDQGYLK